MASLRDGAAGTNARLGERVPLEQPLHLIPGDRRFLRTAAQPLLPRTAGVIPERTEGPQVPDDAVVRVVTEQLSLECLPLLAHRLVPVGLAPSGDVLDGSSNAIGGSLLLHHPMPLAGHGKVVGEPKEVERPGPVTV